MKASAMVIQWDGWSGCGKEGRMVKLKVMQSAYVMEIWMGVEMGFARVVLMDEMLVAQMDGQTAQLLESSMVVLSDARMDGHLAEQLALSMVVLMVGMSAVWMAGRMAVLTVVLTGVEMVRWWAAALAEPMGA
jgi:hypothetical protein